MPASDTPKPNRRRAVVFCATFAVILSGAVYYLWANHAYLKWRFVGGEAGLMKSALKVGQISPDQVIGLVTSGATDAVRKCALYTISSSDRFERPYGKRIVSAIHSFATNLPDKPIARRNASRDLAMAIGSSGRPELIDILERLATDQDFWVRVAVASAFDQETDFGERGWRILRRFAADPAPVVRRSVTYKLANERAPEWAAPVLRGLLDDADPRVRRSAVSAAGRILYLGKGRDVLAPRLREILHSTEEDAELRASAIWALGRSGLLEDKELDELVGSPFERMAKAAREVIEMRAAGRHEAR